MRALSGEKLNKSSSKYASTYIDVPHIAAGFPMMMLSETPAMLSVFPYAAASNK